ncbi:MAG: HK97 family phage prohead protease [Pseudomonadota bacterium]
MFKRATQKELLYRGAGLDRAAVDEKERAVDLSFSSEVPVKRYFWELGQADEILLHGSDNVDLARLKAMGVGLMNHNPNILVGPLSDVRIEGKTGRARLGFDDDADGNRALGKVRSGSLKGVSVGYSVQKYRKIEKDEEWEGIQGPAMVATRWTPYEISLTPIPADASVGVGRDLSRSLEGIEIESTTSNKEGSEMNREEITQLFEELFAQRGKAPTVEEIVNAVREKMGEDSKPRMNITVEQFQDLTARAAAVNDDLFKKITNEALTGKTEAQLLRMINDAMVAGHDAHDTGGHDRDKKSKDKPYGKISDIPDDVFARSLKSPA